MKRMEVRELEKYAETASEKGIELEAIGDNGSIRLKMGKMSTKADCFEVVGLF